MKYTLLAVLGILLFITACSSTETVQPNKFFYNTTVLCNFVGQEQYKTNETIISTDTSEKALTKHFSNSLKWTNNPMQNKYGENANQLICRNENLNFKCNFDTNGNLWDCKHIYNWPKCDVKLVEEIDMPSKIRGIVSVNNKLAYNTIPDVNCSYAQARSNSCKTNSTIYFDGKKIEYAGRVSKFQELNGKLLYQIDTPSDKTLYFDGKKISRYSMIGPVIEIGGKLIYSASKNWVCTYHNCFGDVFIVNDGVESKETFNQIFSLTSVANKPAYVKLNGSEHYVVHGDKEYGPYYSVSPHLVDLNGKIAFIANNSMIFIDGEPMKLPEDITLSRFYLFSLNGNLVYTIVEDRQNYIMIGDEKYGPAYTPVYLIDEKLAYLTYENKKYGVAHGDKEYEMSKERPEIINLNDKLFYSIVKNRERFLFYEGCKMPGNILDKPVEVNGNIAYIVVENDDFVIKVYSV